MVHDCSRMLLNEVVDAANDVLLSDGVEEANQVLVQGEMSVKLILVSVVIKVLVDLLPK